MPSFTSASSVLERFAVGKRQALEQQQQQQQQVLQPQQTEGEGKAADTSDTITATAPRNRARRESSVLSRTSVTELGQSVKRSVSLRSLRSSSVSSTTPGHKTRSSASAIQFNPTLTTSPIEDDNDQDDKLEAPAIPPSSKHVSPPYPRSRSRGKLSISAKSLSSKFSSQSLSTFSQHSDSLDGAVSRPTTAAEIRKIPSASMLNPPSIPKRAPPERPPPPPSQPTYALSHGDSYGSQHGLYLQPNSAQGQHHASHHDPKTVYQQIHEVSNKRIATIEYLRKVHDGNIFYFSTMHYSPAQLQTIPSMHPLKLGRRASNYFVLGYSLPALLDLNSSTPLEYLRALSALLQEFETYQNLMGMDSSGNSLGRGRVGNMFKLGGRTKPIRRSSAATDSMSLPSSELLGLPRSAGEAVSPLEASPSPVSPIGHDFQHLVTPHLPFDPDFTTVYATLCDTLIDTYAKLLNLLPTPDACSPAVGDAFSKADKTLRKLLVSNVMREFEDSTRANVKSEVAGLGKLVLGGLM